MPESQTALRICPFCEATCGLTLTISDGRVTGARGDKDDVFSKGFICPKGASFAELDNDPDRLTRPLVRRDGVLTEATWDEAYAVVEERPRRGHSRARRDVGRGLPRQPERPHRRGQPVRAADHPRARHASGVQRQHPGSDAQARRARLLVRQPGRVHGARPRPHRLPGDHRRESPCVQRKSGHRRRLPRQAQGAAQARRPVHRHRPGPHPHRRTGRSAHRASAPAPTPRCCSRSCTCSSKKALSHRISAEWPTTSTGSTSFATLAAGFAPDDVAAHCGVPADDIRALARELANAPTAAVYGRIGTSTVEFGTLASWLVDVINILTGNLDRQGGAMFPLGAAAPAPRPPKQGRGFVTGRWHSRVSGYPEALSRTARRRARRGDRHPRRGPDQGDDHGRGKPGAVRAGR